MSNCSGLSFEPEPYLVCHRLLKLGVPLQLGHSWSFWFPLQVFRDSWQECSISLWTDDKCLLFGLHMLSGKSACVKLFSSSSSMLSHSFSSVHCLRPETRAPAEIHVTNTISVRISIIIIFHNSLHMLLLHQLNDIPLQRIRPPNRVAVHVDCAVLHAREHDTISRRPGTLLSSKPSSSRPPSRAHPGDSSFSTSASI